MSSSKEVMNVADRLEAVQLASEAADQKGEADEGNRCATEEPEEYSLLNPKPRAACPICMCPLPTQDALSAYFACCGKSICCGCSLATELAAKDIKIKTAGSEGVELHFPTQQKYTKLTCAFCRTPVPKTDEEVVRRLRKRIELKDGGAMESLASHYRDGTRGMPVDEAKYLDLTHKAADHGSLGACYNLAIHYGRKTRESDVPGNYADKAFMYLERGAVGGDLLCRYNFGVLELNMGRKYHAAMHFCIAAEGGYEDAAKRCIRCYEDGIINKATLERILRAKFEACQEMKTDERDKYIRYLKSNGTFDERLHTDKYLENKYRE